MIKDTTSGAAGQKPNAGATPEILDIMVGQHDWLKCGMVILVKPKTRQKQPVWDLEKQRSYSLHTRLSKLKCHTQKAIKTWIATTNKHMIVMILHSYKPCPEEITCLEDTSESVAFQR